MMRVTVHGQVIFNGVVMFPAIVVSTEEGIAAMYMGVVHWFESSFWRDINGIFDNDPSDTEVVHYATKRDVNKQWAHDNVHIYEMPDYDDVAVQVVIGQIERAFVRGVEEMVRVV